LGEEEAHTEARRRRGKIKEWTRSIFLNKYIIANMDTQEVVREFFAENGYLFDGSIRE